MTDFWVSWPSEAIPWSRVILFVLLFSGQLNEECFLKGGGGGG